MLKEEKKYSKEILSGPFKYCLFRPHVPKAKAMELLEDCIDTGWIGEGPKVKEFEGLISNLIGNKFVTALNSGTSALELALNFCRTERGKRLAITTPMTCMATTIAIINAGLEPYFVDIDPITGLLSAQKLAELPQEILNRAAAIMTVHWGGNTMNMRDLGDFATNNGIMLIVDAAHAFGSSTVSTNAESAIVGGSSTYADFTCFSFQAIKHVTTGDGGAVAFNSEKHWLRSKPFKWFGIPRDDRIEHILGHSSYDIVEAGRKWQLNDIAASIGIASFGDFERNVTQRRAVAAIYDSHFKCATGKEVEKFPARGPVSPNSSYWLYTILVRDPYHFSESMRAEGIEVSNVHIRNDAYSVTKPFTGGRLEMDGLDYFSKHSMNIPVGPWIRDEDAAFIAGKALEFGA